jgi:hypothetical protein
MADILITADRDIDMTNGKLSMSSGVQAHAQRARMHYMTFYGESVYDRTAGVPWIQTILGSNLPPDAVRLILDLYGRQIPGILSTSLVPDYDRETRKVTFTGSIETIEGDVVFAIEPLSSEPE